MLRVIALTAAILQIVGCAAFRATTQAPSSDASRSDIVLNPDNSFYACRTETRGSGTGSSRLRVVSIRQAGGSHGLLLALGTEPAQLLSSVPNSNGQLYANAHLAWSSNSNDTVLTDIDNIQTYACRPVSYGDATALLRGERTGGPTDAVSAWSGA